MAKTIEPNKNITSGILNAIVTEIKREVDEKFEKIKEDTLVQLEEIKGRVIAQAVIKIHEHVRIQDFGNKLVIEVVKTTNLSK